LPLQSRRALSGISKRELRAVKGSGGGKTIILPNIKKGIEGGVERNHTGGGESVGRAMPELRREGGNGPDRRVQEVPGMRPYVV